MSIAIRFTFARTDNNNDAMYETYGHLSRPVTQGMLGAIVDRYITLFNSQFGTGAAVQDRRMVMAESFDAAGPAVAVRNVEPSVRLGAGVNCPPEVMLAISRDIDTVRGLRPRGRIFFPMGTAGAQRPTIAQQDLFLGFARQFHLQLQQEGVQPCVNHRQRNGLQLALVEQSPILRYSADNTWDTQRRRDLPPTERRIGTLIPPL